MNICNNSAVHPITGRLKNYESSLEQFLRDEKRGMLHNFNHLELKNAAPPLLLPKDDELTSWDFHFSTAHKPEIVHQQYFEQFSTVFSENVPESQEPSDFMDISHKMDKVVKELRSHLKIMIPYFPELARLISWRHSVYLLHMLWYIRERMNPETGIAIFRSKKMAHYLAMSNRTERRLRLYFIDKKVFNCTYDRHHHYLKISINWEGFNAFLTRLSPKLAIFDEQKPFSSQPLKTHTLTPQEEKNMEWFMEYLLEDASKLNPQQIITAVEDLGVVPLLPEKLIRDDFRYFLYDCNYPLAPYLHASWKDIVGVFGMILRTNHAHLIPAVRPLSDCPSYYYKGVEMDEEVYASWDWRQKITYTFTKRIAHLITLKNYEAIAGHISIVEWRINEENCPEFLIATRNGVMAVVLGSFFTSLMYFFKENFRFYIVPLEGKLPYTLSLTRTETGVTTET